MRKLFVLSLIIAATLVGVGSEATTLAVEGPNMFSPEMEKILRDLQKSFGICDGKANEFSGNRSTSCLNITTFSLGAFKNSSNV